MTSDKRLTLRLTEYWNTLRGDASLPQWEKFDTNAFGDIWQQCCEWKIEAGDGNTVVFTYDYMGRSLKELTGGDLTGQKISASMRSTLPSLKEAVGAADLTEEMFATHFRHFPVARIIKKIDRVIKKLTPVIEEGRFNDETGKTVRFRSCLLPFGKDGKVSNIVLGLSWKVY